MVPQRAKWFRLLAKDHTGALLFTDTVVELSQFIGEPKDLKYFTLCNQLAPASIHSVSVSINQDII